MNQKKYGVSKDTDFHLCYVEPYTVILPILPFIEPMLSLGFSLTHFFFFLSEDGKNRTMNVYACRHICLYIVCVVVCKVAAWFSRMLNSNSWMRTFKSPIHLKIKPLIWVSEYNFRPSILKYSHFILSATERKLLDCVLTGTYQHCCCPQQH